MNAAYEVSELLRLLHGMVDIGVVSDVDHDKQLIRCSADDDVKTDWLPVPAEIGRNYVRHRPLRVGQGVVWLAPNGDLSQSVVVCMLHTGAAPVASKDPNVDLIQFENGSLIQHNIETGDMQIKAVGSVTWEATRFYIKGPVTQTGGDMTSDGVSAQNHKHEKTAPHPFNESGKPSK